MENNKIEKIIEALLFVSATPLKVSTISKLTGAPPKIVSETISFLKEFYNDRGIQIHEVAGGWQMRTNPACAEIIKKHLQTKPVRLTKQALETLSMIAYMQPVTKAQIEQLRGVDTSSVIKFLMDNGFIKIIGQKEVPGRPFLYGTTEYFLEFFGLKSLSDLPVLQEQIELGEEDRIIDEQNGKKVEEENELEESSFMNEIKALIEEMKKEEDTHTGK